MELESQSWEGVVTKSGPAGLAVQRRREEWQEGKEAPKLLLASNLGALRHRAVTEHWHY